MNAGAFHFMVAVFTVLPPAALILLIGLWLFAVIRLKGAPRLALLLTGLGVFLLAVVLFGGQWLLRQYELAWRQWVKISLAFLLWSVGAVVSCLTVYFIPQAIRSTKTALRRLARVVAAFCLVIAMGFGTIWGGLWAWPASEEVIVYHGVKAVQEESNWLDESSIIYEYHSPFTRGTKAIGPIGG